MTVPKEVSIDAGLASLTSELESISSSKKERRIPLKAFFDGKDIFAFLPTGP